MTMAEVKSGYEALGGRFIEYEEPKELFPNVWLTGPVPRPFPEKNWSPGVHLRDPSGKIIETTSLRTNHWSWTPIKGWSS